MYQQHKTGKNSEYLIIFSTCYHQRIHIIWKNLWAQGTVSIGWLWSSGRNRRNACEENLLCHPQWRLKLCDAKQKQHVNGIQSVCRLLWVEARLKWTEAKSKTPFLEICIMKKKPHNNIGVNEALSQLVLRRVGAIQKDFIFFFTFDVFYVLLWIQQ